MEWGREIQGGTEAPINQDRARLIYSSSTVLARQQLDVVGGARVLLTVPPLTTYVLRSFSVFNTDAAARLVTIRLVAPTGVDNATSDYWEKSVAPRTQGGETPLEEVLTAGYQIVAYADVAAMVNIKINGAILTQQ